MNEIRGRQTVIVADKSDGTLVKLAKIGALVVTSPLIFCALIVLVPLAIVFFAVGAALAFEVLPWLIIGVLAVSLIPVIRKKLSGENEAKLLQQRLAQMELDLLAEREKADHLDESVKFYKKLVAPKDGKA